jgi:hypothetical protein
VVHSSLARTMLARTASFEACVEVQHSLEMLGSISARPLRSAAQETNKYRKHDTATEAITRAHTARSPATHTKQYFHTTTLNPILHVGSVMTYPATISKWVWLRRHASGPEQWRLLTMSVWRSKKRNGRALPGFSAHRELGQPNNMDADIVRPLSAPSRDTLARGRYPAQGVGSIP